MTKSNVATMPTRNANKRHPRLKNAPLVKALEAIRSTETTNALARQCHLTELMLNDIVKHGSDYETTCTYRLTDGGDYFMAKNGKTKSVQLSASAKKRLTELTGGKVTTQKGKKIYTGLFSDQDFRRGFDYIKVSGKMIKSKDKDGNPLEEYVVDDVDVNNAMRNGKGWDNLGKSKGKKRGTSERGKDTQSVTIRASGKGSGVDLFVDGNHAPVKNTAGMFVDKKAGNLFYTRILKYCAGQLRNHGEMSCKLSINGKDW